MGDEEAYERGRMAARIDALEEDVTSLSEQLKFLTIEIRSLKLWIIVLTAMYLPISADALVKALGLMKGLL